MDLDLEGKPPALAFGLLSAASIPAAAHPEELVLPSVLVELGSTCMPNHKGQRRVWMHITTPGMLHMHKQWQLGFFSQYSKH